MSDENTEHEFINIALSDFANDITEFVEGLTRLDLTLRAAVQAEDAETLQRLGPIFMGQVQRLTIGTFPTVLQFMAETINVERARVLALETAINESHATLVESQVRMIRINAPGEWVDELMEATVRLKAGVDEVAECRNHDHGA